MNTRRYALYGALFGLFFPVGGTLLQALFEPAALGFGERLARAQGMPLLWIIDSAPLFLGLFAALAGKRQDQLLAAEEARRAAFARTAREVFAAAGDLHATVSSFSSLSTETAASVRETTATMTRLGQTAAQSALTAETVVGLAQSSRACSEEGLRAVDAATAELTNLTGVVRGLSGRITALNDRIRSVFELASVVGYVAEQTQRLAAGAAVELQKNPALRPFAPVVSEMRRQADQAQTSALQVKRILGDVDQALLVATKEARQGAESAEHGALVAGATGDTIRKLARALVDSSQAAREIAQVARQQDHGIDQVLGAMNEIFRATEETVTGTHRIANDARSLSALAQRLDHSVQERAGQRERTEEGAAAPADGQPTAGVLGAAMRASGARPTASRIR